MPDREQLLSLAERVEAATAQQQFDLLGDAWDMVAPSARWPELAARAGHFGRLLDAGGFLDAAMMLVPEGWHVLLERWSDGRGRAEASTAGQTIGLWAATAPLALTAACLRALAHVKEEG